MEGSNTLQLGIDTQLVHAGERRPLPAGMPVSTPIYASATYTYDSMAEVDQVFAGAKQGYVYARYGNPTTAALEDAVCTLERGAGACAYASGMAALHAALFACELSPGSTVVASQDLYGASTDLLYTVFGSFGVKTVTTDFSDLATLREIVTAQKPRALLAETISNPLLKICDVAACAEIAHAVGARLVVDNTFASPYLCQPLTLGADFSVHSATKYLGGHADTMGGVTVARAQADMLALVGVMKLVGGVLDVWPAHEILRGVKTLALRMERQCANALALASTLQHSKGVARVFYPGLEAEAERAAMKRTLTRDLYGALVSIELLPDSNAAAFAFMDALKLCVRSTSLGDVFTGVLHPATASHREVAPARRRKLGIADSLVRISVGIENVSDISADVLQALEVSSRIL